MSWRCVYACVCVCACFKESHSVTPRISISLHDSPPDLHTRTCTCTLRYFTSVYRFAHRKWGLANVHVHISLAFPTARQLKKMSGRKYRASSLRQWLRESKGRKERHRSQKGEWVEGEKKIQALKYLKLLCAYI